MVDQLLAVSNWNCRIDGRPASGCFLIEIVESVVDQLHYSGCSLIKIVESMVDQLLAVS